MKRTHAIFTAGITLALLLLALAGCNRAPSPQPASPTETEAQAQRSRLAVPGHGIYAGAYADFGDREDDVTLEKIEAFEAMVGKHQAILASSSYWGEQSFPKTNLKIIARHNSIPLVFWSPWDRPYKEGTGPDKYSLRRIIGGEHDAYIDRWADGAKEHAGPIMVSFCNEMNGAWFPWSGVNYGAGKGIPGTKPERYEGPELFKQAWRHVVDRVRARGADNVIWVFHTMDFSMPNDDWNLAAQYYPGADYVDWMGFSLYGNQFVSDHTWAPFFDLIDWPYKELTLLDPKKPIMLCEWGVGEFPKVGDKGGWIRDGFRLMSDEKKFPRLKAAVFWHERWQNSADEVDESTKENAGTYSDLRVNSSPGALDAYRKGVASPFFLSDPIWVPKAAR
ncbi:MAG: glycosyl hydrolase [Chthoniobacteraceae bacterium]